VNPGRILEQSRPAKLAELALVTLVAVLTVNVGWALVGDEPLARQVVVWVANVLMLSTIWLGLRLRGQTWKHFGLSFRFAGGRTLLRTALQSVVVLIVALVAFIAGGMAMTGWAAGSAAADMSGYSYLQGNLPMLLLALAAVYVVSSFGEEAIYRGFLMNRLAELATGGRVAWSMAIVISAIVFGLVHFDWGVVGIVQTALMGLALAVSYLAVGRNLWVVVLAHACIDTLLLVQLYLGPE